MQQRAVMVCLAKSVISWQTGTIAEQLHPMAPAVLAHGLNP